jgi:hypothetical protein
MRATFQDALDSSIPKILNLSPTDPRCVRYVNEATQRLVTRGKWWGTVGRFRFCTEDDCLTWPRQIAAIEAVAVCDRPITIRNGWFEFLESGYGLQDSHGICGGPNLFDRGECCTFADIRGTNKKIKVYADVPESSGAKILIQGYDQNDNWIRTEPNGVGTGWEDGEYVGLDSATPQTSTKFFKAVTSVQKPETNGVIRLYELDTSDSTQRAIAIYEWDETRPTYRKSQIPGLSSNGATCNTKTVTVVAKLAFIPVKKATDWLLIGNIPALKDMCMAIYKRENNLPMDSAAYEASAINELQKELSHHRGSGVVNPVRMQGREIGGPAVLNLI